jgi:hypothetical protein
MNVRSHILFLCVHNAGRSQMAAAFAREIGGDRIVVHSAGSSPGETLNPAVVSAMLEKGIDISNEVLLGLVWVNSDHPVRLDVGSWIVRPPQQR